MAGVCTDVASLMICMDGQIEPHELRETRIVVVTQHGREVSGPVFVWVNAADLSVAIEVAVDGSCQRG